MMRIERTDQWMLDNDDPLVLCKKLETFFKPYSFHTIHDHLFKHGLYGKPMNKAEHHKRIQKLRDNHVWKDVEFEAYKLQKRWKGPHIPIFIFLSNEGNIVMREKLKGRGGIAFKDKLILFVSESIKPTDLRTLLTHEYHHTVRLSQLQKPEAAFTLLDSIIMEGLAENAVREQYDSSQTAYWTSLYSESELNTIWHQFIKPNLNLNKSTPKHHLLLHGHKNFPEMAGYCCGYMLVKNYMKRMQATTEQLIDSPAHIFLNKVETTQSFKSSTIQNKTDNEKA